MQFINSDKIRCRKRLTISPLILIRFSSGLYIYNLSFHWIYLLNGPLLLYAVWEKLFWSRLAFVFDAMPKSDARWDGKQETLLCGLNISSPFIKKLYLISLASLELIHAYGSGNATTSSRGRLGPWMMAMAISLLTNSPLISKATFLNIYTGASDSGHSFPYRFFFCKGKREGVSTSSLI